MAVFIPFGKKEQKIIGEINLTQMQMKTKNQPTHIARQRMNGVGIKERVIETFEIDEQQYNNIQFEFGIEFLNELYPENSKAYAEYFKQHSRTKNFWQWWKNEWHIWQQELLRHCNEHSIELTFQIWFDEMRVVAHDQVTNDSFSNYLKIFKNELSARP